MTFQFLFKSAKLMKHPSITFESWLLIHLLIIGKNPSKAQSPWDPGPLWVWSFPAEQLWAVHHQLRQREAPAGLHWGNPWPRAGGIPQWRSWMDPGARFFLPLFNFTLHFHFSLLLSHFAFQFYFHFSFLFSLSSALLIQVGFFTNSVICQLVDQGSLGLLSLLDEASNRFSNASPTASTDQVQLIYTNTNRNKTQIQNKYKVKDSTDLTARSKSQYSL